MGAKSANKCTNKMYMQEKKEEHNTEHKPQSLFYMMRIFTNKSEEGTIRGIAYFSSAYSPVSI